MVNDAVSFLSRYGVQNFKSKMFSALVHWIGQERLINRGQCEFGTLLRQQHLACARANNAVFRKPRQTERAKKVSARGISFKARQCDVKQRVIWKEN